VAITRAKHFLIVIGHGPTLMKSDMWADLIYSQQCNTNQNGYYHLTQNSEFYCRSDVLRAILTYQALPVDVEVMMPFVGKKKVESEIVTKEDFIASV